MLGRLFGKKDLGRKAEATAERFLKRKGFRILERNYRCSMGEIDIIAMDGETLVFVEVKARSTDRFGTPLEAVHERKRQRLRKLALYYIKGHYTTEPPVRFDIIGVSSVGDIQHIKGAF